MAGAKYFVALAGGVNYGFVAPDDAYNNISDELGVTLIDGETAVEGLVFGVNSPKPPRVRLSGVVVGGAEDGETRSARRFCASNRLEAVLGGSVIGQTMRVGDVDVRVTQVST